MHYLNTNKKNYFLKVGFIFMSETLMRKQLKLTLLLILIFIPVFLSEVQINATKFDTRMNPIIYLPEEQNDANTGEDAGDNFDNATIIGIGSFTGSLPEGDTDDFYTVYIIINRHAVITLEGDNGTDFDLHLYTPERNPIISSTNNDSSEYIELDILSYGYWFVRIEKYNLTSHGNYSLIIQTSAITSTNPTLIQNDANSGGDAGNTFNSATEIIRGQYFGVLIDFDYFDFYKIQLVSGDIITIRLTFEESLNFDLFFYNPQAFRLSSSTQGITSEEIDFTVADTGHFRILVSRLTGQGSYQLLVQISHPSELDFNWKALVAFGVVLVVIIASFLTARFIRRRQPSTPQTKTLKEFDKVEKKVKRPKESEIIDCDNALSNCGTELSDEEKNVIDKILSSYSKR